MACKREMIEPDATPISFAAFRSTGKNAFHRFNFNYHVLEMLRFFVNTTLAYSLR